MTFLKVACSRFLHSMLIIPHQACDKLSRQGLSWSHSRGFHQASRALWVFGLRRCFAHIWWQLASRVPWMTSHSGTQCLIWWASALCQLRLQHTFGLSGCAISWIRSYLTDRSSFVKIDSSSSPSTTILTGVPQGSVLGPLLFVLFISTIANVINFDQSTQNNTVSFHQYADDTQLYIGTNSSTLTS